ncbi:phage portal protein [Bradyrhizobium sp. DOA9]|uniref:phage portal protein n=1 Tax=Bradyrhizobium sp. DOA9 TaxID=1126627 RepID=UPI00046AF4D0|nr:phage portal protein [Bradyrhizobium sp. DOA9]GAJ35158.1 portal protein [Bradyrhizobium sp. DOA9]
MSKIPVASPTFIDRVVSAFSPSAGLARLQARTQLMMASGSYNGGARDRRPTKRWRPKEGSADADTLLDLPDLRARSRDLRRNAPLATGAIATNITHVVGDGLQLQASIDHEALGITPAQADAMEREQEREWELFSERCDFTRVQCMDEMEALAFGSELESGDNFAVRRYRKDPGDVYGTKVQLIEADRVCNPHRAADSDTIKGGIEHDGNGVPVAYHITNKHPGGLHVGGLAWERVPARTDDGRALVLHMFERTRPDQTRGVPYLAPVIEAIKQLADYSDAEVTAAVISAMFTLAIETPDTEDGGEPLIGETDSSLASNEVKLGAGAVISLAPGEKATAINPTRPNEKFDPFFLAFCRQIGVALELPFELLVKHFTASYSASRAALELAWQYFRKRRRRLAAGFVQPVYEWMMEEAVASGRLNRPGFFTDPIMRKAYCGAEWIGPQRASLNPKQESDADKQDVEAGFKTIEQVCMERTGGEFEKKNAQRAKEQRMRKEAGLGAPPPSGPGVAAEPQDPDQADDTSDDETQPKRSKAS